jgi:hypothetical protein
LLYFAVTSTKNFTSGSIFEFTAFLYHFLNSTFMAVFRRSFWFFNLIWLALAFVACRDHIDNDTDIIVTVDPEFAVDLFEQRDSADGSPTFGLWVESTERYECAGYGIDATVEVQGENIRITLLGVLPAASPCAGDSAAAQQFLPIGNLPDGTYYFTLSLRDAIVNEGTLTVANNRYQLSLPNPQGIDFQNLIVDHLPDGLIWGYAAMPDESVKPTADNFIADLKTLTDENGLAPGYYSYFTVSGTGNVFFHKSISPSVPAAQFVRRLTASASALKSLLQEYRSANQQPLTVKCWTTEGEK